MVKSAIIFSDKNRNQKRQIKTSDRVSLSRDEYRNVIREAYQEGRNDALKESKQNSPAPRPETKKRVRESYDDWKKEHSQQNGGPELRKETVSDQQKERVEIEGKEDAIKKHAQQKEENRQRFKTITARREIEIMRAKGIFPFSLFPDTLIIDTTKVSVSKKQLFATEHITTIPLKDVGDVTVQTVMFLAGITITYMPQMESAGITQPIYVTIPNLKREDAIRAKNILKGVLVAKAEEIDIAKLPPGEVVKVLEKFGESEGVI